MAMGHAQVAAIPQGACDCHTHVIGSRESFPMVADRHYTPDLATVDDIRAHLSRIGFGRVVIVQPSVYGTDNRCMLDALDRLRGRARGVAVVEETTDEEALRSLHARGVRALRVNLESAGLRSIEAARDAIVKTAERVSRLAWHIQLYAAIDITAALAETLSRLPVPVVLDHFAMMPAMEMTTVTTATTATTAKTARAAPNESRLPVLIDLLESGNAYIKLSAPYRISALDGALHSAVTALAGVFLRTAPDRVLWGSDWPHTSRDPGKAVHETSRYRVLPESEPLASLRDWLATPSTMQKVLVDNPARLYGF